MSIDTNRTKDMRIEMFRKFMGLDLDRLPYSIFEKFVIMIKATNIPI